jgi:hypothetical protein
MQKQRCIFYNINFSDRCEKREDIAKECIEQGYKDMRESLLNRKQQRDIEYRPWQRLD